MACITTITGILKRNSAWLFKVRFQDNFVGIWKLFRAHFEEKNLDILIKTVYSKNKFRTISSQRFLLIHRKYKSTFGFLFSGVANRINWEEMGFWVIKTLNSRATLTFYGLKRIIIIVFERVYLENFTVDFVYVENFTVDFAKFIIIVTRITLSFEILLVSFLPQNGSCWVIFEG